MGVSVVRSETAQHSDAQEVASISRRKAFPARLGRYLIRRFATNVDDIACDWCVRNLGILDWMAREVGPYLAVFANRKRVQAGILTHLKSPMNNSSSEESALLRVLLSAKTVGRDLLNYCRTTLSNRSADTASRQWAAIVLGRHGDPVDHQLIARHHLDDEHLARASAIGIQAADSATRGKVLADVAKRFPSQTPLVQRVRGLAAPWWPTFDA